MRECENRRWGDFFFFNDTATTEIYTLSLHDALPILSPFAPTGIIANGLMQRIGMPGMEWPRTWSARRSPRSEEHTSELQSRQYLVCRLLLEKKIISSPPWRPHSSYRSPLSSSYSRPP